MSDQITAFLPCRQGSERVKNKNTKPFANFSGGLVELKLTQLIEAKSIDRVVLSTDDDSILEHTRRLGSEKIVLHKREAELASSATSTDALVGHARSLVDNGHILWTHVTSPFINATIYDAIVEDYRNALRSGHDSLMTVTPIQGFLWDKARPINYDRAIEKWPRTQTLEPIYEINSGVFLAGCDVYDTQEDRIGKAPFLHVMDKIDAMDIDWPHDFVIAEQMVLQGVVDV